MFKLHADKVDVFFLYDADDIFFGIAHTNTPFLFSVSWAQCPLFYNISIHAVVYLSRDFLPALSPAAVWQALAYGCF